MSHPVTDASPPPQRQCEVAGCLQLAEGPSFFFCATHLQQFADEEAEWLADHREDGDDH